MIEKPKRKLVNFKVLEDDLEQIRKNAKRYAGGNLSLWLVSAGLSYRPKAKSTRK